MDSNSWDSLLCNYFYRVCIDILGGYFTVYNFTPKKDKIGGVIFNNDGIFVEISYDPEAYPAYTLSIVMGFGEGAYDDWGRFTGLPLWSIVPPDNKVADYPMWNFKDEKDLTDLLNKVRDEVLEQFGRPLWENKSNLEFEVEKFKSR